MIRNFLQSLAAVLVGNAAYFSLARFLPSSLQHEPFRLDLGLALDAGLCLVALAVIKLLSSRDTRSKVGKL